jgi:outer membrane biosynthesis protein TonB
MSTAQKLGQFSLKCLDPRISETLILDRKKIVIGSHESCDFRVTDRSVSSYHAFLCLHGEGFMVKDLYSESGVYLNGRRVEEAFVNPGDVLTIGTLSFVTEFLEDSPPVFNPDETIAPVTDANSNIELPPKPGLIFIDGEYCDIEFDDSHFTPLKTLPQLDFERDYIELEDTVEPLPIIHKVKDMRLEVATYVNGLMMDVSYHGLKSGDYYLSPAKRGPRDIPFHTIERTKIFTISKGELRFYQTEVVTPSVGWDKIALTEALFLTHGTEQVSLRFVDKAHKVRPIPLMYRDREFLVQAGKVFAGLFLPFLLLLFITIPHEEVPKEEIAVVYKLPEPKKAVEATEKSEVAAVEPTPQKENTGHKQETEQVPTKVEMAEASQQKKVVAKATAPEKPTPKAQPQPTPQPVAQPTPQQVAKAAAPAPTPVQVQPTPTPPVKSYSFKSSVSMNSIVGDAPKVNTAASGSTSASIKDASFNAGTADNGQLVAGANIGVSKFNGSDKKGTGANSFGSRGLAAKTGFDSSYLEPKTVVMGSMDPEVLRKILREYIPQFRHCYQQELVGHSEKIKGVIDLNFTINQNGKVGKFNIKVKDAKFSDKGVGCMGRVLGLIEFPKPKGGGVVDVRQPLNFFSETEKI